MKSYSQLTIDSIFSIIKVKLNLGMAVYSSFIIILIFNCTFLVVHCKLSISIGGLFR